jgi:hypothetical protein
MRDPTTPGAGSIANTGAMLSRDRKNFMTEATDIQSRQEQADANERKEMFGATQDFANFDPFDDETLDRLTRLSFAEQADAAAAKFMDTMGGVQSTMGAAGITGGGVAAGLAAQAAQSRFQSIVTGQRRAMSDLATRQMEMRASKKMAELEARSRYAAVLGKDVPTTTIEALQNMMEVDLAQLGIVMGYQGAKDAATKARQGALIGAAGGLAKGVMGGIL